MRAPNYLFDSGFRVLAPFDYHNAVMHANYKHALSDMTEFAADGLLLLIAVVFPQPCMPSIT